MSKLEELINSKLGGEEETHEEALDELYFDFEDGGESDIDEYYSYDEEDFERRDKGLKPRFMLPDGTKIRPEDSEDSDDMDITPELKDINESINTTLSKYFE